MKTIAKCEKRGQPLLVCPLFFHKSNAHCAPSSDRHYNRQKLAVLDIALAFQWLLPEVWVLPRVSSLVSPAVGHSWSSVVIFPKQTKLDCGEFWFNDCCGMRRKRILLFLHAGVNWNIFGSASAVSDKNLLGLSCLCICRIHTLCVVGICIVGQGRAITLRGQGTRIDITIE